MDEFALIARDYAPLSGEGALALRDDVARFRGLVVTTDTIACGVHYLPRDPLSTVARKAVRVNVSDVVAKGCRPVAATLAVAWHEAVSEADHAAFAAGLGEDLREYAVQLLGGDTTRLRGGEGPTVTVTMFGEPVGEVPTRAGAEPGDDLYVTGTIGDAWLGLRHLTSSARDAADAVPVVAAYRTPAPPVGATPLIARYAKASLDVSDGLLADAGHLARASGVGIAIEAGAVPLSAAGRAFVRDGGPLAALCTGGDDYQALFAARRSDRAALREEAASAGVRLTRIGACVGQGDEVMLLAPDGTDLTPAHTGYAHF